MPGTVLGTLNAIKCISQNNESILYVSGLLCSGMLSTIRENHTTTQIGFTPSMWSSPSFKLSRLSDHSTHIFF